MRSASTAWVRTGKVRKDAALRLMRIAADLEDSSEKHMAMENRLWPMRELLEICFLRPMTDAGPEGVRGLLAIGTQQVPVDSTALRKRPNCQGIGRRRGAIREARGAL